MLDSGPYPRNLRERIYGGHGHLSNEQAAEIIYSNRNRLKRVWLCHLSNNNNTAERARTTVEARFKAGGLSMDNYLRLETLQRRIPSATFNLEDSL